MGARDVSHAGGKEATDDPTVVAAGEVIDHMKGVCGTGSSRANQHFEGRVGAILPQPIQYLNSPYRPRDRDITRFEKKDGSCDDT